ncbi:Flagellar hook-basal body complex protein FliE [Candidatus Hydrogenisulfobacillus filiaventi]|uniref:Flagellar hook-basal body complex protein FliE n=1 Tax=Candidatus Hydrogenisulfobacillus filiaventi TaxID=2707344 RepID=A0A6F8ZDR4_9FIRM|nr:flagellar hook-basal body complex protein FliE [Bacillota bacterium]CAB1128008.1 Flagellar hook-basal body complex protein FliE [Candidatus Hydrogenisulfobacillus filiaventi]
MSVLPVGTGGIAVSPAAGGGGAGSGFARLLERALAGLESSQTQANQALAAALSGQGSVTGAMVALVMAQSTLDVGVAVRNGVVQAYQEIMNMPLD